MVLCGSRQNGDQAGLRWLGRQQWYEAVRAGQDDQGTIRRGATGCGRCPLRIVRVGRQRRRPRTVELWGEVPAAQAESADRVEYAGRSPRRNAPAMIAADSGSPARSFGPSSASDERVDHRTWVRDPVHAAQQPDSPPVGGAEGYTGAPCAIRLRHWSGCAAASKDADVPAQAFRRDPARRWSRAAPGGRGRNELVPGGGVGEQVVPQHRGEAVVR